MRRKFPTTMAAWATPSYQRLVFSTQNDSFIGASKTFEAEAFLTKTEKKKAGRRQEVPFNRLRSSLIESYSEWKNAKLSIRDKNKAKKEAKRRKIKLI